MEQGRDHINPVTIEGTYDHTIFSNEENGWTVGALTTNKGIVTIVGNLGSIVPGEQLKVRGKWEKHPKYGLQIITEAFESILPATIAGIQKYLGSGLVEGIGPIMAKRIVQRFGIRTIEIIDQEPQRLREVSGVGKKRCDQIGEAWKEQKIIRGIFLCLQSYQISPTLGIKIYRRYGDAALEVTKRDPYRLAIDIAGIGFKTADSIARGLGIMPDSKERIFAGIIFTLREASDSGHTYLPRKILFEDTVKLLGIDPQVVEATFNALSLNQKEMVIHGQQDQKISLKKLFLAERAVSERITDISTAPKWKLPQKFLENVLGSILGKGLVLSKEQGEALIAVFNSPICIITGGPGTGKTTVLASLVQIARNFKLRFHLAAPTGRASKRLAEATRAKASTIHRLLEYHPQEGRFRFCQENPLDVDLIILDEVSMLDVPLCAQLLEAVPSHARLVFVGDIDQLPSVGPGNILRDLIESGKIATVRLTQVYRQGRESQIVTNAHRVNQGQFLCEDRGEGARDFYFVEKGDPELVLKMMSDLCKVRIPQKFHLDPIREIQILTPMHRGIIGTENLNRVMQEVLNPNTISFSRGNQQFKVGDKVIQLKNNYELDVFNGDIGVVEKIDLERRSLTIQMDERRVEYPSKFLDEIALAYAISVHKSQGSEYPAVVFPLLTQHYIMLQRNLLYTAISRAKKLFVLIGTTQALSIAIRNADPIKRYTNLKEFL